VESQRLNKEVSYYSGGHGERMTAPDRRRKVHTRPHIRKIGTLLKGVRNAVERDDRQTSHTKKSA
jgi:hypothetical protein